jgi:hypothetical protein
VRSLQQTDKAAVAVPKPLLGHLRSGAARSKPSRGVSSVCVCVCVCVCDVRVCHLSFLALAQAFCVVPSSACWISVISLTVSSLLIISPCTRLTRSCGSL